MTQPVSFVKCSETMICDTNKMREPISKYDFIYYAH